jgi:hypothetical protein
MCAYYLGNDFGRQESRPRSDNIGVRTVASTSQMLPLATLKSTRKSHQHTSSQSTPASSVISPPPLLDPTDNLPLTKAVLQVDEQSTASHGRELSSIGKLRSHQLHSRSSPTHSPNRYNSQPVDPVSARALARGQSLPLSKADDVIITRAPPLSSRSSSREEDASPSVSTQGSLRSKALLRSRDPSPSLRPPSISIDDPTDLPLSAAERAPPGTELPVKASEEFRRKWSAKKITSSENVLAATTKAMPLQTASNNPSSLHGDELIINEKDHRLSDLRLSGRNISSWESTWATPRKSGAEQRFTSQSRKSERASPPPGTL